ncbi:CD48 antigen isoform X2 [Delphinapterus leucas]|uniref:CD48 antigen isoform X2 n=1 Tax=Delphinapterus leucas TaxID=9749 RepID=A0A2Y9MCY0_DELLE|nr:CD48 antigen isoform X2 [Delphinapterus leucas]
MCSRRWELSLALELLLLPHLFLATSIQVNLSSFILPQRVFRGANGLIPSSSPKVQGPRTVMSKGRRRWISQLKDRARLDLQSGTLHIHNVQKEDSSTYLLMVLKDPGYEDEWKISLVVLDPVPKPVIEVKKTQEVNKCHLTLSCVIQDQPVNYTWYAESLPKESRSSVLEVTHTPQNYSSSYTCQVSNPVSSQNNTVNFTSPCVLATSSGVAWTATWLVIMVTTVLGLLWI